MTRKIIFNIGMALALSVFAHGSIATEKPVQKQVLPVHLVQQQTKVNKIKETKEGKEIFNLVDKASKKYGVDKKLIHSVILVESGYSRTVVSSANCVGLMQLGTVHAPYCNRWDKASNIDYGTKYLANLLKKYNGNEELALCAYHAGAPTIDRSLKRTGTVPKYAKRYANKVREHKKVYVVI